MSRNNRKNNQQGPVGMLLLLMLPVLFLYVTCTAQEESKKDPGIYVRENNQKTWQSKNPIIDFAGGKKADIKLGDTVATKDETIYFDLGDFTMIIYPFSSVRLVGEKKEDGGYTISPELLLGEMLVVGGPTKIILPGQTIYCDGRSYAMLDEDKYSVVASITGEMKVQPTGAPEPVNIPAGAMLELGPGGETGEVSELTQDDIDLYSKEKPTPDMPGFKMKGGKVVPDITPSDEYWNKTRVVLLQDGEETPEGQAIAKGLTQAQEQEQAQGNIQVFDKKKTVTQKNLSFGTTVSVTKKTSDVPKITSLSFGGVKASPGDTVNVTTENIDTDSKILKITGTASTSEADQWRLFIKVDDEETQLDGISSFSYELKITQDFADVPVISNITICDKAAEQFLEEGSILNREDLISSKIVISGQAVAPQNMKTYTIGFVAKDTDDNEHDLGSVTLPADLSGIDKVEVSVDNGIGWNTANGTTAWTYSYRPNDLENYSIKVRAVDVMGNTSEEQFEPYTFKYDYRTDPEMLKDTFEAFMRAFNDMDRSTLNQAISQDFSTNIEGLRDYTEFESSVNIVFDTGRRQIYYTIEQLDASRITKRGTVDFYWYEVANKSNDNFYAAFTFEYTEGQWKLQEIIDENTFLRLSRIPYEIELSLAKSSIDADGEETTEVYGTVKDSSGFIVASEIQVSFSVDTGGISPDVTETNDEGKVTVTYTSPTSPGTAVVTATSGSAVGTISVVLDPIQAPCPPDGCN